VLAHDKIGQSLYRNLQKIPLCVFQKAFKMNAFFLHNKPNTQVENISDCSNEIFEFVLSFLKQTNQP